MKDNCCPKCGGCLEVTNVCTLEDGEYEIFGRCESCQFVFETHDKHWQTHDKHWQNKYYDLRDEAELLEEDRRIAEQRLEVYHNDPLDRQVKDLQKCLTSQDQRLAKYQERLAEADHDKADLLREIAKLDHEKAETVERTKREYKGVTELLDQNQGILERICETFGIEQPMGDLPTQRKTDIEDDIAEICEKIKDTEQLQQALQQVVTERDEAIIQRDAAWEADRQSKLQLRKTLIT